MLRMQWLFGLARLHVGEAAFGIVHPQVLISRAIFLLELSEVMLHPLRLTNGMRR